MRNAWSLPMRLFTWWDSGYYFNCIESLIEASKRSLTLSHGKCYLTLTLEAGKVKHSNACALSMGRGSVLLWKSSQGCLSSRTFSRFIHLVLLARYFVKYPEPRHLPWTTIAKLTGNPLSLYGGPGNREMRDIIHVLESLINALGEEGRVVSWVLWQPCTQKESIQAESERSVGTVREAMLG